MGQAKYASVGKRGHVTYQGTHIGLVYRPDPTDRAHWRATYLTDTFPSPAFPTRKAAVHWLIRQSGAQS